MEYRPPAPFEWDENARELYWAALSVHGEQNFRDLEPKIWGWAILDLAERLEKAEKRIKKLEKAVR